MTQHMKYKALIILALLVCALMTYLLLNPSQNTINLTYTIDAFDVEKNEMIVTLNIDNQTNIDLSSLPAGNYFLHIVNDATKAVVFNNHFTKQ